MTQQELKKRGYFAPELHTETDCRDFNYTGQCEKVEHYENNEEEKE